MLNSVLVTLWLLQAKSDISTFNGFELEFTVGSVTKKLYSNSTKPKKSLSGHVVDVSHVKMYHVLLGDKQSTETKSK